MFGNHGEGPKPPKTFPAAAMHAVTRRLRREDAGAASVQFNDARARIMAFNLANAPAFGGVQ